MDALTGISLFLAGLSIGISFTQLAHMLFGVLAKKRDDSKDRIDYGGKA